MSVLFVYMRKMSRHHQRSQPKAHDLGQVHCGLSQPHLLLNDDLLSELGLVLGRRHILRRLARAELDVQAGGGGVGDVELLVRPKNTRTAAVMLVL